MLESIPIQNIYYLLCFAWNKLDEGETVDVSSLDSIELADLFAVVLSTGVRHLVRRGLDRDYIEYAEETPRLRGRVNFAESIKRNLLTRRRPLCEFDELSYDVPHNRILKSTIDRLLYVNELARPNKEQLREASRWFRDVGGIRLSSQVFRRVQLHRNNNYYRFLLNVCQIVYESVLIDERTGQSRFRDFIRDEGRMRALFEEFVRNFYKLRQNEFRVESRKLRWNIRTADLHAQSLIPEMRTDICLESSARQIIIDCKFAKDVLASYFNKESLKPGHLYQMYTYLRHAREQLRWNNLEGILLYPATRPMEPIRFELDGFPFKVCTVDLNADWKVIERQLLETIAY